MVEIDYDAIISDIVKCKKVETNVMYKNLCNINKIDNSNGVYYTPCTFFSNMLNTLVLPKDIIIEKIEDRVARDKYLGTDELNKILREEITTLLEENNTEN